MGNTVDKMRQRELARRETKREELVAFLEGSKRRQSLLEVNGQFGAEDGQNANQGDGDRQGGFGRSQLPGGGGGGPDDDGDHRLTDRDREAWLYRMENEALEVINDNMELQEERRRERERREERREELENMGVDGGMGMMDPDQGGGEDPNAQRDEAQQDERTPVSSRRSSLVASSDDDIDDDLVSNDDNDDLVEDDVDDVDEADADEEDAADDAASEGAPESDRGEPETAQEEAGGGDDDEHRRGL